MDYRKEFERMMQTQTAIALATSTDGVPNVRIVNFHYDAKLKTLYFSTFRDNQKVAEFKKNTHTAFTTVPTSGEEHVRVKNGIVTLSYSARRVGAVLYGHRNRFGLCHKSQNLLAKYAHCSADTVRKALEELERAGYITHYRNHKYSVELGRVVFDRNTYVCDLSFRGGFTMIPRHIMDWDLTPGAFSVCLFLCQQAGNRTRAFPSLKEIGVALGMSHATVCRAVAALKNLREMLIQACIKVNRAFSKNSYIFVVNTIPAVQRVVKGLKSSFLCHNSTAVGHEKQSDFNMPSSLIIRELLWYLDNEGITRERRNIGATKKGGLLSIKQRQSALSSVPIASTALQHHSCPEVAVPVFGATYDY